MLNNIKYLSSTMIIVITFAAEKLRNTPNSILNFHFFSFRIRKKSFYETGSLSIVIILTDFCVASVEVRKLYSIMNYLHFDEH